MPLTPKNRIWYADTTTPLDPAAISAAEATSIENALNLRSRFNFSWLNQSERENQLGMVNGSTGYQIDTKTEYIYDTTWRLKTPYAEYAATGTSAPGGSFWTPTNLTLQTSLTTDVAFSSFAAPGAQASIVLAVPGLYSVSWTTFYPAAGGAGFALFTATSGGTTTPYTVGGHIVNGANHFITVTMPLLRTTTLNQAIFMYAYTNGVATTSSSTVRVGRIG